MTGPLEIRAGVIVPEWAIEIRATRAGGPGGQNVNKVSSKVEMRIDPARVVGLTTDARRRLLASSANALDAQGWLRVTSQRHRDQRMNIEDARAKVRQVILRALEEPRPRRKTKPTRGSVERRLADKRHRARKKAERHEG